MMPNIMARASPLKTGSRVITKFPNIVVPAVSKTGRIRTSPAAKAIV